MAPMVQSRATSTADHACSSTAAGNGRTSETKLTCWSSGPLATTISGKVRGAVTPLLGDGQVHLDARRMEADDGRVGRRHLMAPNVTPLGMFPMILFLSGPWPRSCQAGRRLGAGADGHLRTGVGGPVEDQDLVRTEYNRLPGLSNSGEDTTGGLASVAPGARRGMRPAFFRGRDPRPEPAAAGVAVLGRGPALGHVGLHEQVLLCLRLLVPSRRPQSGPGIPRRGRSDPRPRPRTPPIATSTAAPRHPPAPSERSPAPVSSFHHRSPSLLLTSTAHPGGAGSANDMLYKVPITGR